MNSKKEKNIKLQIFKGNILRHYISPNQIIILFENEENEVLKLNLFLPRQQLKPKRVQLRLKSGISKKTENMEEQTLIINRVFVAFNYDLSLLTELSICFVSVDVKLHGKMMRLLHFAPKIQELRLEEFKYSEKLFVWILQLTEIYLNKMNIILFHVYSNDLNDLNEEKCLYILSLISSRCFEKFHGQLNRETLLLCQKYFYIAADRVNRQKRDSKIYLGSAQQSLKSELKDYMEKTDLKLLANSW